MRSSTVSPSSRRSRVAATSGAATCGRRGGRSIGVVDFVRVGGRREVRVQLVTPYADQVRPDVALTDALNRQQQAVRNITERVVARLKFPLKRAGDEYSLGRLIADAQRAAGRADVAIMNNGGIRADLSEGTVTWGQAYQVQPVQNRLLRLTGTRAGGE